MSKRNGAAPPSDGSNRLFVEVVSEGFDTQIVKGSSGGPRRDASSHRPNLDKAIQEFGRHFPSSNNVRGGRRTYGVNEKMLAEADRRGLRIGGVKLISLDSLGFLFGRDEE